MSVAELKFYAEVDKEHTNQACGGTVGGWGPHLSATKQEK